MGDEALFLARIQFAFTVSFHFVFPAFSIGLASFLMVLEAAWLRTGRGVYANLYRYWLKIFAVAFGMGVVSGIVMSYQFGTNWSVFSDKAGPIVGPLMAYEVLTAFFLEAGFLGVMLFGINKVGQFARPLIGEWVNRQKTLTMLVDRGSILLVVYSAFSAGVVAGIWSRVTPQSLGLVIVLDLVMLAIVLVATTAASRFLRFTTEDEIAIVFCGSKKSMASGLPMANIIFPASAVGLIVLPLMLFHQMQLMVCAALALRYARRAETVVPIVPART